MQDLLKLFELSEDGKEIKLFPYGIFKHPFYGKMTFDDAFFDELIANFYGKVLGETKPFIDRDHAQGESYGWIDDLSKKDGLYASVTWTELGIEAIQKGIYRYISPWWGPYEDPQTNRQFDNVLRGAALTNTPFLKVMPAVELSEKREYVTIALSEFSLDDDDPLPELEALLDSFLEKAEGEVKGKVGAPTFRTFANQMRSMIRGMVKKQQPKAGEEPDKDSGKTAAKSKGGSNRMAEIEDKRLAELEADSRELSEAKTKLADTERRLSEVTTERDALKEKDVSREKELAEKAATDFVEKALNDGKIAPAQQEEFRALHLSNKELAEKIVANAGKVVDTKPKGSGAAGERGEKSLDDLAKERMREDKTLSYREAVDQALRDNPELAKGHLEVN